jgi:hypothetical protein
MSKKALERRSAQLTAIIEKNQTAAESDGYGPSDTFEAVGVMSGLGAVVAAMVCGPAISKLIQEQAHVISAAGYAGLIKCNAVVLIRRMVDGDLAIPTTAEEAAELLHREALPDDHRNTSEAACCSLVWMVLASSPSTQFWGDDNGQPGVTIAPSVAALLKEGRLTEASYQAELLDLSGQLHALSDGIIPIAHPDAAGMATKGRDAYKAQIPDIGTAVVTPSPASFATVEDLLKLIGPGPDGPVPPNVS